MRLWMSTALASLALAGAVVAGCGSSKAPSVANLGATTTSSTPNPANGESPSSPEEKAQLKRRNSPRTLRACRPAECRQ
jgi:hypothetical protein